ncbi:hypothetical protein O0235_13165 [Tepidiforma flava]|uniref:Uncharacterized protein n=1 Tax=Tepidiforma flava TaxID=3004094 RepID=A0ABY7M7G0_9CHLR|nr:hypothetical protein [Tepidiforma flava]WBL35711.1 hypothetical protein O0235_13165 [Tepidiforma flava]
MTIRRRNNAPIRPRPGAPAAADFAFAFGSAALVMAAIFGIASFTGPGFAGGKAGADLARLFAVSLGIAAVCSLLIGALLAAGAADAAGHIVAPAALGAAIGALEALLLLEARVALLPLPLALLLFVPLPVRRILRGGRGR